MNIDFYLTHAHSARKRTAFLSIAVGVAVGALTQFVGASSPVSVTACLLSIGLVEIIAAVTYQEKERKAARAIVVFRERRELLYAAVSASAVLVLSALRIPRVVRSAFEYKLDKVSSAPVDSQDAQEVRRLLTRAKAADVRVPTTVVENIGMKFIKAGAGDPSWEAALACVEYRSFLNASSAPSVEHFQPIGKQNSIQWDYDVTLETEPGVPFNLQFKVGPRVPAAEAFVLERFGHHLNVGRTIGFAFLLIQGGGVRLDGLKLRHIIFANTTIVYGGVPIELHDVYFVNCTFKISPEVSSARELVAAILRASPVEYTAPPA